MAKPVPFSKLHLNCTLRSYSLVSSRFSAEHVTSQETDERLLVYSRNFALKSRISGINISSFSPTARFICRQNHAHDCELQHLEWFRHLEIWPLIFLFGCASVWCSRFSQNKDYLRYIKTVFVCVKTIKIFQRYEEAISISFDH